MQIKYILDYKGYDEKFTFTGTKTGECYDINRKQAEIYMASDNVWLSVRADVSLRSVSCEVAQLAEVEVAQLAEVEVAQLAEVGDETPPCYDW